MDGWRAGTGHSVEDSPPQPPEKHRRERLAALLILILSVPAALVLANRALSTAGDLASDEMVQPAEKTFEQFQCIERVLRRELPANARVLVIEHDSLWAQRLVELASPDLAVVDSVEEATHEISVEADRSSGDCSGMSLMIIPR